MITFKRISAQEYIDTRNGENKVRDSKPEHEYYCRIISELLNQRHNLLTKLEEKREGKNGY